MAAQSNPQAAPLQRTWTVNLQAGFASTFQLTLGGMFGEGPAFQNRLTASVNNVWRRGDSVSLFGWSTTDVPSAIPSWQTGLTYKYRVLQRKSHSLSLASGVQRWLLPTVKTGAQDWLAYNALNYAGTWKRLPIAVSQDSWTLLRSPLAKGSLLHTQIYTQHALLKAESAQLVLRHGPQHTYSWGFYGTAGHRVMRYAGSLVLLTKHATLEAGYRQQVALQDRIPNNRYWSFALTRQFGGQIGRAPRP